MVYDTILSSPKKTLNNQLYTHNGGYILYIPCTKVYTISDNGCLMKILVLAYYNPKKNWVVCHPQKSTLNNHVSGPWPRALCITQFPKVFHRYVQDIHRFTGLQSTCDQGPGFTGLGMCKVCTEAVHAVALGTGVTLQVWACVKYVPKQSIP